MNKMEKSGRFIELALGGVSIIDEADKNSYELSSSQRKEGFVSKKDSNGVLIPYPFVIFKGIGAAGTMGNCGLSFSKPIRDKFGKNPTFMPINDDEGELINYFLHGRLEEYKEQLFLVVNNYGDSSRKLERRVEMNPDDLDKIAMEVIPDDLIGLSNDLSSRGINFSYGSTIRQGYKDRVDIVDFFKIEGLDKSGYLIKVVE